MTVSRIQLAIGLFLTASPIAVARPSPADSRSSLAIRNVNIVDVQTGRILRARTLVIEGSRIRQIAPARTIKVRNATRSLDAAGAYLIPGLIDTHAHLWWVNGKLDEAALSRSLSNGVTTIRHAGRTGGDAASVEARDRARRGEIASPRISVSGMINTRAIAKYGCPDARALAVDLVRLGVDGLKVRDGLTIEDVRGVIDVGKAAGMPVYGHTSVSNDEYSALAVTSGLAGIMHVPDIVPLDSARPAMRPLDRKDWQAQALWWRLGWLAIPKARQESLIKLMVRSGAWLEPTLIAEHFSAYREEHKAIATRRGSLPMYTQTSEGFPVFKGQDLENYRKAYRNMAAFVRNFARAGGLVLAGTDCVGGCGFVQDEMALLVGAGLRPLEALQAATLNAARALRYRDIGRIETGMTADLVLIDGNPLDDIRATRKIVAVVQGGKIVSERKSQMPALSGGDISNAPPMVCAS